jgi:predicted metallo-beta-lactamase superfamily hydrolase
MSPVHIGLLVKVFVEKEEEKIAFAPPVRFLADNEEKLWIEGIKIYPNLFLLGGKIGDRVLAESAS